MAGIPDDHTIKDIIHNYVQNEKTLVKQLYFKTSEASDGDA